MVKFKMVGDYKNARNIGNLKASVNLKNGNLVTVDRATGTVALPTATTAKKGLWLVQNEREPVEYIGSTPENIIAIGEPVRLFDTATLKDVVLEIDDSVLTTDYASISKGDTLVADTRVIMKSHLTLLVMKLHLQFWKRQTIAVTVLVFL